MKKRTSIDFSQHEIKITKSEVVSIYELKKPGTRRNMLVFINCSGVMTVTGDFGNWVFCREFHPGCDGVSGDYWDEKLQINSVQKSSIYDSDETLSSIEHFMENFDDKYGREMNDEESDWIDELEENVNDEHGYIYVAYRKNPYWIDRECVPFRKKRHAYLDAVYDGFDFICHVLKNHDDPVNEVSF